MQVKKILSLVLVMAMAVSMTACGSKASNTSDAKVTQDAATEGTTAG